MKNFFIISSVAFLVALIFWGIYNFAFKNDANQKADIQKVAKHDPAAASKKEESLKIKDISNEGVIAPVVRPEGNKILFYAALDGKVFSIDFDGGGKNVFSSTILKGLSGVTWSADKKKVISEFDGGAKRSVYNYESKIGKGLGAGMYNLVWSNLGDKLLYQFKNGKTNELSSADWDGANWKKIADSPFSHITIAPIPQTSLVTFWNYPASGEETTLSAVGILGGEVKRIFGGKFGADYLWAPNGKKALVSFVEKQNGSKINLGFISQDGVTFRDLAIPTLVSKCAWSLDGKTVFYALPGNAPDGSIMPDDYRSGKFKTSDTFWKVDTETGEKTRLIELEELAKIGAGLDATNLFLSDNEDSLFFVNRQNNHLYRLEIAKK